MKRLGLLGVAMLALWPAVASAGRTSFFLGFGVGGYGDGVSLGVGYYGHGYYGHGYYGGGYYPYHYYAPYAYGSYYYTPAPVVVESQPAVTYVEPAPVSSAPAATYYAQPTYYTQPTYYYARPYYAPATYYYGPSVGFYYGGRYFYRH